MAANQPFSNIRNDTFQEVTSTISRDGSPVDLTGATIAMMLRLVKAADPVALSLSSATTGITITDAVNGDWSIDKQIISIDAAEYFYDVQLTESNGDVTTLMEGVFTISQDVTYT